jgi:hypothetical protein
LPAELLFTQQHGYSKRIVAEPMPYKYASDDVLYIIKAMKERIHNFIYSKKKGENF